MDELKQRGLKFSQLRTLRGMSVDNVATMLRVSHNAVVAFECGVLLQRIPEAETRLASLMLKWEAETYSTRLKPQRAAWGKR